MEICHEADSEQSTEPLLPAAEFWKIFHTSVPALFNNEGDIVQKLGIIIQRCGEDYEYYTPPISVHRAEYEAKLPHYNGM
ncbi:hypothetical protein J6590_006820 [Homalodisca vitripennis]|nr:hypothetical protein J6590_006820 [Homalodisca vitripennis]